MERTKKTRQQVKDETRERILKAGSKIIAEEGYSSFTMNKISKTAGISQPGFYVHFDSITDLLKEIIDIHYKIFDEPNAKAMLSFASTKNLNINEVLSVITVNHFESSVRYPAINLFSAAQNTLHKSELLELIAAQFEKSKVVFCEAFRLILKNKGLKVNSQTIKMNVDILFSNHDTIVMGYIEGRYKNKKLAVNFLVNNTIKNFEYLLKQGKAI